MYLLDTDIIIGFFEGDNPIIKNIEKISPAQIFVSSLTLCELYKGAFLSNNPEAEQENIFKLLTSIEFVSLDKQSCKIFGKSYAHLSKIGKITQEIDLMIASIAILKDLILVTKNKKHFENIPGLKIEQW